MIEKLDMLETWIMVLVFAIVFIIFSIIGIYYKLSKLRSFIENDEKEKELLLRMLKLGHKHDLDKEETKKPKSRYGEDKIKG